MPTPAATTDRVENFIERSPWNSLWFSFALGGAVGVVDFLAAPFVVVPTYVIIPVMLLAWNWGVRYAVGLALVLGLAHFGFRFLRGLPAPGAIAVLNAVMRFGVVIILATVTARLGRQTRTSRERVKLLEGILPICAYCKDIRDEHGEWEKIEAYVSEHSEAHFSHGICPTCAEREFAKLQRSKEPA